MTPVEFIAKWRASELKESSATQEHFIDLCRLLGEPTPAEADPTGERYCFERGARKDTGGDGWADVWKRGCFAWEYKGKHADLDAAFNQLRQYALSLENPPLLIASDMARFRIRTNCVSETYEFALEDLTDTDLPGPGPGVGPAGRPSCRRAVQPRCLRSHRRPAATLPHACRPPRVLSPVQTMISVRSGRIASACLRETTTRFAVRRPFDAAASGATGRISPLARARNLSTTKRSSARPVPNTWIR